VSPLAGAHLLALLAAGDVPLARALRRRLPPTATAAATGGDTAAAAAAVGALTTRDWAALYGLLGGTAWVGDVERALAHHVAAVTRSRVGGWLAAAYRSVPPSTAAALLGVPPAEVGGVATALGWGVGGDGWVEPTVGGGGGGAGRPPASRRPPAPVA